MLAKLVCPICRCSLKRYSAYTRKVIVDDGGKHTQGESWIPGEEWRLDSKGEAGDQEALVTFGVIDDQGWVTLTLIRVYCTGPDRHTHVLLPCFLLPHKHHLLATYEQVIDKTEPYVFVSPSTKKRMRDWWTGFIVAYNETCKTWSNEPQKQIDQNASARDHLKNMTSFLVRHNMWPFPRSESISLRT